MPFSPDTTVGSLAAQFPATAAAFHRFGIEPCCDARLRLAEACRTRRVPYAELVEALTSALRGGHRPDGWSDRPLTELTAHLADVFHDTLRDELPRITDLASRAQGHGHSHRRALVVVLHELTRWADELEASMLLEERELFPLVARLETGSGAEADAVRFAELRRTVEASHEDAAQTVALLAKITDGYQPPANACSTVRRLYHALEDLERFIHLHIHLEGHVLFPRAAALAARTERVS